MELNRYNLRPRRCHINDLPTELLIQILGCLPRYDLVKRASAVCKMWHEAAFDQDLLKKIHVRIDDKLSMQVLSRLVKSSTTILQITLDEKMLDETFPTVLKKPSSLQTLELSVQNSQQDSSDTDASIALTSIGQHCVKLKKLILLKIDGLTDSILTSILRSCNELDILMIDFCKNISTSVLSVIGENARQLTEFTAQFPENKRLSDHSIENLVDGCRRLRELKIFDIDANFSDRTDWKCIGNLQHLRVLVLEYRTFSSGLIHDDAIIHWIIECKHLKCLVVYGPLLTDKALKAIGLSKLTDVGMIISSGITPQGLELLATSTTLREIIMQFSHDSVIVDGHGIIKLAQNLKSMEKMSILLPDSNNPIYKHMEEISSVWKGVYPISLKVS